MEPDRNPAPNYIQCSVRTFNIYVRKPHFGLKIGKYFFTKTPHNIAGHFSSI
jgi:hypothetical protein